MLANHNEWKLLSSDCQTKASEDSILSRDVEKLTVAAVELLVGSDHQDFVHYDEPTSNSNLFNIKKADTDLCLRM